MIIIVYKSKKTVNDGSGRTNKKPSTTTTPTKNESPYEILNSRQLFLFFFFYSCSLNVFAADGKKRIERKPNIPVLAQ